MYIELQLSKGVFGRIIRNRLRIIQIGIDREVDYAGNRFAIDKITFGSTLVQREHHYDPRNGVAAVDATGTQVTWIFSPRSYYSATVPFLQVKQFVTIHLVADSDLEANGASPSPPSQAIEIAVVFDVSLSSTNPTRGGAAQISYRLAYIDYGFAYGALSQQQRDEIRSMVAAVQLPPTTVEIGVLQGLLKSKTKPLAWNAGIALTEDDDAIALRIDFDVSDSAPSVSPDFFRSGPANVLGADEWAILIDGNFVAATVAKLLKDAFDSTTTLVVRFGPTVRWDPGSSEISATAGVEMLAACPFPVSDIDLDADLSVRVRHSIAPSPPDTLHRDIWFEGHASDIGEQILCALSNALLWPFIGPYLLRKESFNEGIAAYLAGLVAGPPLLLIGIIAAIKSRGVDDIPTEGLGGSCRKIDDGHYACDEHLDMTISLSPPYVSRLGLGRASGAWAGPVVAGAIVNLPDRPEKTVTVGVKPFEWKLQGTCRVALRIENSAEIVVEGTGLLTAAHLVERTDLLEEFEVSIEEQTVFIKPKFLPAYVADPYLCRVRVVTTAGVRTITLAPPVAITDQENRDLKERYANLMKVCRKMRDAFRRPERLTWELPPPPSEERLLRDWQVAVHGLQHGETLAVYDANDQTLVETLGSADGFALVRLLLPQGPASEALTLDIKGRGEEDGRKRLSWQQTSFVDRAFLPVNGRLRAMRFEGDRLIVVDEAEETEWDVRLPSFPVLLSTRQIDGGAGADGIVVHNGRRLGDPATPVLLRAVAQRQEAFGPAQAVGSPRVGGVRESMYLRDSTGAAVYDISDAQDMREIQRFSGAAWFEGVALGGRRMARHDMTQSTIGLYEALTTKVM